MAGSVNKVILVGNLGGDPDIRSMQSGDKVANLNFVTLAKTYSGRHPSTGTFLTPCLRHNVSDLIAAIIAIDHAAIRRCKASARCSGTALAYIYAG